ALDPREDRDRDLVDLRRREDELHVRRRLLERLQERVPRVLREHVDLVHDEDLVAIARWSIREAILQLADVVDAGVAGSVDLTDVEVVALGDLHTGRAAQARGRRRAGIGAARLRARIPHAIERLGPNAGARGLADAAAGRGQEGGRRGVLIGGVLAGRSHVARSGQVL